MKTPRALPCPCGRLVASQPLAYTDCCGRYLDHFATTPAPDAESLMRSRYSAFVRGRTDYLVATWHPGTRPEDVAADPGTKWLGLDMRAHRVLDTDQASVTFVARYRLAGRGVRLHERSHFVREAGRWLYVNGEAL